VNVYARSRETFWNLKRSAGMKINGLLPEEAVGGVFLLQQGAAI
jgi:hypothetical protein